MRLKLYTDKVVAAWLELSPRRVRQLRDEGILTEVRPGLFDLKKAVGQYIRYLGGASRETLNEERLRLTVEKRKAIEMENAEKRKELHRTEDVEKGIQAMCLNIRSRFLAMPAKLSHAIAALGGDQAAVFDELKNAIHETLEELNHYDVSFAVDPEKEEENAEA